MESNKEIPTQLENPNGLHQRYSIKKLVKTTYAKGMLVEGEYIQEEATDPGSEYFVMRLDEGGKDPIHINACRIGVNAYADAIKDYLPELAKDLKQRYPAIIPTESNNRQEIMKVLNDNFKNKILESVLQDVADEILAAITPIKDNVSDGWIKVEDRLPDYDEYVLWYTEDGNPFVQCLDKDGNDWLDGYEVEGFKMPKTTHWQPLPKSPKQ